MNGFVILFYDLKLIDGIGQNDALTFGAIWRLCQLNKGVCNASPDTIGDMIFSSANTVRRSLKFLTDANMIKDVTPDRRGKSHEYVITDYARSVIKKNPALPKMGRERAGSTQNGQRNPGSTQNGQRNPGSTQNGQRNPGSTQNGQSALPKMGNEEVVVVDEKGDNPEKFEKLLARWFENLKEPSPREIEMFGDYYDEHPEWTARALDETIIARPSGPPFRYFKRIINEWIKKGGPQERPSPSPPPKKYANGGHYGNETKSPGHKLTEEQQRAADLVRQLGRAKSAGEPVS